MPPGYTTSTRSLGSPAKAAWASEVTLGLGLPVSREVTIIREGRRNMTTAIRDDMFTPDVIADPYTYYGRLRDEDPIHWNDTYALWVITRHDDVTWMTRHNELFSSAVFRNDPKPAYPAIDESDLGLYEYVRHYQGDQFIQHDRPEHL